MVRQEFYLYDRLLKGSRDHLGRVAPTELEELDVRGQVESKCAARLDSVGESSFGANFEKRLAGQIYVCCKIVQHA
jgi:hypothetical protein